MDPPGSLSLCACIKLVFMVVYLLASACCSETDHNCVCTVIPPWPQTQPATPGCFHKGGSFRYKCIDGYVRKAGTSNLIRCDQDKWSNASLQCIVNPLNPPRTTTEKTSTTFPTSPATPSSGVSTMSSETEYPDLTSTILPRQHTPEASLETSALPQTSSTFPTSPATPSSGVSTMSSETEYPDLTSTILPRQHTPGTPSTSPVSTSASLTPERFNSTSSLSSPTTTHRPRRSDRITSPSSSSLNSTSSTLGTDDVATKVIAPVTVGILVLAVIGAVWFLYRRKSRKSSLRNGRERPISPEESVPMQQTGDMT